MLNVLLIDDDSNMKTLLDLYFKRRNVDVNIKQVNCTKEAEGVFSLGEKYDLWIIDHKLPSTTGLEFLRSLKEKVQFIYGSFYLNDKLKDIIKGMGGIPIDKSTIITNPDYFVKEIQNLIAA